LGAVVRWSIQLLKIVLLSDADFNLFWTHPRRGVRPAVGIDLPIGPLSGRA
jgi:hypothetical protein